MPEFHEAEVGISSAHISDELQFSVRVGVGMAVRCAGLAGEGFDAPIVSFQPEVDVRLALVVFATGTCNAKFLRILHQELPEAHVLCYTGHEGLDSFLHVVGGTSTITDVSSPSFLLLLSNMYCKPTRFKVR